MGKTGLSVPSVPTAAPTARGGVGGAGGDYATSPGLSTKGRSFFRSNLIPCDCSHLAVAACASSGQVISQEHSSQAGMLVGLGQKDKQKHTHREEAGQRGPGGSRGWVQWSPGHYKVTGTTGRWAGPAPWGQDKEGERKLSLSWGLALVPLWLRWSPVSAVPEFP